MKTALLSLLLSTAALAQTCDYYPLTTCSQTILGPKSFPDGIIANITSDGGSGVYDSLYVRGFVGVDGGLLVDGGVQFNGTLRVGGTITAQDAGFAFVEVGKSLSVDGTQLIARTTNFSQFSVGSAGNAWLDAQSSGVTVFGANVASATNGYAGGRLSGYYSASDLASTHSDLGIACTRLQHPIVSGSAGRINATVEKAGGTGGTFNIYVKNETNGQILCFENGISCTSAAGQPGNSAACTWDAGVVGDDVCVHVNTTSCTGTDPGMNVTAEY